VKGEGRGGSGVCESVRVWEMERRSEKEEREKINGGLEMEVRHCLLYRVYSV
jgi:hypothetical protein